MQTLIKYFIEKIADRIADEVLIVVRKRVRYQQIDEKAAGIKAELDKAQSTSEREAVLDKIHSLVNDFDSL